MSFNSLNNSPAEVVYAMEETKKLAEKLKAKQTTVKVNDNLFVTIEEDCDCFGCGTMRHKCEKDNAVYDDDGIYMHTQERV